MKELSRREKRKLQRETLFRKQRGKCYWCGGVMTLENSGNHGDPPQNFATFEHLYDRFHAERMEPANGTKRIALACRKCNHKRGQTRESAHLKGHSRITHPKASLSERRLVYSTEKGG